MNFVDTEIDNQMRWLGIFVIGLFTIIVATNVFYYNIFPHVLYSLGFGIIISAIPITYLANKLEKKNAK